MITITKNLKFKKFVDTMTFYQFHFVDRQGRQYQIISTKSAWQRSPHFFYLNHCYLVKMVRQEKPPYTVVWEKVISVESLGMKDEEKP